MRIGAIWYGSYQDPDSGQINLLDGPYRKRIRCDVCVLRTANYRLENQHLSVGKLRCIPSVTKFVNKYGKFVAMFVKLSTLTRSCGIRYRGSTKWWCWRLIRNHPRNQRGAWLLDQWQSGLWLLCDPNCKLRSKEPHDRLMSCSQWTILLKRSKRPRLCHSKGHSCLHQAGYRWLWYHENYGPLMDGREVLVFSLEFKIHDVHNFDKYSRTLNR